MRRLRESDEGRDALERGSRWQAPLERRKAVDSGHGHEQAVVVLARGSASAGVELSRT